MRVVERGLTLIEVLIIIVIIGILFAVAIPKWQGRGDKERLGALKGDIRNAERAEDAYFDQFKSYATFPQLQQANLYHSSSGDSVSIAGSDHGYVITAVNAADPENVHTCTLTFAAGAPAPDVECR